MYKHGSELLKLTHTKKARYKLVKKSDKGRSGDSPEVKMGY